MGGDIFQGGGGGVEAYYYHDGRGGGLGLILSLCEGG